MNPERANERARAAGVWIPLAMLLAVVAVYCPWGVLTGREALVGLDHQTLHARRMAFAREALFGERHELPAWYPRELLGTPFRANLQNFPLIPTRLIAFVLFEPDGAFAASVVISACLAAAFTYLLCRRFELSRVASAAAGWTFACCGFFASRVLAGHTPLLEAYPALPALLYGVERVVRRPESSASARWNGPFVALALASACFALAGHPQLTLYSLAVACAFAFVRARRIGRAVAALVALLLGFGVAGFALAPMASLAQRSTRVLELKSAPNDLALPYGRIAAMWLPWRDGWPALVQREPAVAFQGYPADLYFWDTVTYCGWLPWIALAALVFAVATRRERSTRIGAFFAIAGAVALALALPWFRGLMAQLPGTILRSPSRWMFVVGFCLALALGVGVDALLRSSALPRRLVIAAVALVLALHALDLGSHARAFVRTQPKQTGETAPERFELIRERTGDGRVGIDSELITPHNRELDDVGFFDSLLLARPYRFVLETSGAPPRLNEQMFSGGQLARRTLRACGVRYVWTTRERGDLTEVARNGDQALYEVPKPEARASFAPSARVRWLAGDELHQRLRDASFRLEGDVLLDERWKSALGLPASDESADAGSSAVYRRPSSDRIEVDVECAEPGLVRVLESWDPGWSATVDGAPVSTAPADDVFLAAAVASGRHAVIFEYRTPGAAAGVWISVASVVLVLALAFRACG